QPCRALADPAGALLFSPALPLIRRRPVASLSRSTFLTAAGAAARASGMPMRARAAERIGVDYAYYNPPSLVLKSKGWLEEALGKRGTSVEWGLSLGSNKANQFLQAGGAQF